MCTVEGCQSSVAQNVLSVQIKSQNNTAYTFYIKCIVHYEFMPTGQSESGILCESSKRLCEKINQNVLAISHRFCI